MTRAAFYYDGFNLYHALKDYGRRDAWKNGYKWLNLKTVSENIASSRQHHIVKIAYFSALFHPDKGNVLKHQAYIEALESVGVCVTLGHYSSERVKCPECGRTYKRYTEKETDINLALSALIDARDDLYDVAYIVTTDGDQRPVFREIRERFGKKIITVNVPGRHHNKSLIAASNGSARLTENMVADKYNKFPDRISVPDGPEGHRVILMPPDYA